MTRKRAARAVPDMRDYTSPHMPKAGVRYLTGKDKVTFLSRLRRAFRRAKVKLPA